MHDAVERFTARVRTYARYRPGYPPEVLAHLEGTGALQPGMHVVDVGCGTGNLARLFTRAGYRVTGVEPNAAMRRVAAAAGLDVVAGTAESLPLQDGSAHLLAAGQAFHWFDVARTRRACARVLVPGGIVALVWNNRRTEASPLQRELEAALRAHCPEYTDVGNVHFDRAALRAFFGGDPNEAWFLYEQTFDREGFLGRVFSASYTPLEEPRHGAFRRLLDAMFTRHARRDHVTLEYDTVLFHGALR